MLFGLAMFTGVVDSFATLRDHNTLIILFWARHKAVSAIGKRSVMEIALNGALNKVPFHWYFRLFPRVFLVDETRYQLPRVSM